MKNCHKFSNATLYFIKSHINFEAQMQCFLKKIHVVISGFIMENIYVFRRMCNANVTRKYVCIQKDVILLY